MRANSCPAMGIEGVFGGRIVANFAARELLRPIFRLFLVFA
jgi:hypothetical protein